MSLSVNKVIGVTHVHFCVYLNLGKSAARRWPIGIEVDLTWRTGDWQIQCANVRAVGFRTTAIACLIHCLKITTIRQCCR